MSIGGSIATSVLNLDAPLDARDLAYDFSHWGEGEHFISTLIIDAVSVIPLIGVIKNVKYIDDVADIMKYGKRADDIIEAIDNAKDTVKAIDNTADALDAVSDAAKGFDSVTDIVDNGKDISKQINAVADIADSADALKRVRGRRGLDILQKIRQESRMKVKITEEDFEDIPEVDSKLVQLAQQVGGKIITNDFNLNKVAQLRGVEVLNINALSNAVKPVVIPGESMQVAIVKSGKEAGQGVAYLEDGTMIVVENGNRYMGETIEVEVTSALQTAAGRMIFAKPKN